MSMTLPLPGHDAARPLARWLGGAVLAFALLGGAYALVAQVAGERGIAPTAASAAAKAPKTPAPKAGVRRSGRRGPRLAGRNCPTGSLTGWYLPS